MVFIACICLIAFKLLVKAQQTIGGDYGAVAQALYGNWLRYLIQFFLCLSQVGFVASYLIFISQNVGLAVDALSSCHAPFESKYYIWMVLIGKPLMHSGIFNDSMNNKLFVSYSYYPNLLGSQNCQFVLGSSHC